MHRTPPVVVHLQAQRAVQAAVALVGLMASGGLSAWAVSHHPQAWAAWLTWLIMPVVTMWAWQESAVLPRRLRWDGEAWWLTEAGLSDEVRVRLAVLIDLDTWLLLRASPGPRWLPLSSHQQAGHWGALRATLFAAPGGVDRT